MKSSALPNDPVQRLIKASELVMQKLIHKEAVEFVENKRERREAVKAGIKNHTVRVKSVLP